MTTARWYKDYASLEFALARHDFLARSTHDLLTGYRRNFATKSSPAFVEDIKRSAPVFSSKKLHDAAELKRERERLQREIPRLNALWLFRAAKGKATPVVFGQTLKERTHAALRACIAMGLAAEEQILTRHLFDNCGLSLVAAQEAQDKNKAPETAPVAPRLQIGTPFPRHKASAGIRALYPEHRRWQHALSSSTLKS